MGVPISNMQVCGAVSSSVSGEHQHQEVIYLPDKVETVSIEALGSEFSRVICFHTTLRQETESICTAYVLEEDTRHFEV